jgi:hypothetical protein
MENTFPSGISPDGRAFLDRQDNPFFWLGDTAWSLFTNCDLEGAKAYLTKRANQGFTVIQCVLTWFVSGEAWDSSRIAPNLQGEYPWIDSDPAHPNPAYFENVDAILRLAQELNLTLAILPTWGNVVTDLRFLTTDNARLYGFWLGQSYRACPNLVWINGGDCLPHNFADVFDALAEGLRQGDGGAHLITFHPCHLHSSSQYFNDRSWYDFHMIQSWTDWHKVYESVLSDLLVTPARPVVLGEGAYENGPEYPRGPITPLVARRQAWWAFMAGGYTTYGHNSIWRAGPGWEAAFDSPGAVQMGIFKQIVCALPWWQRLPDPSILEEGASDGETHNVAVRSLDGSWLIIYLSSRTHVLVRLEKLAVPKAQATWINPATGERKDAGAYETYSMPGFRQVRTTCFQWFTTPDHWEDAVLLLEGISE